MGTLNLAALLVLFEKSRLWVGTGFHLLPSFHHHHPRQHNYTTQTVKLTVTFTSTFSAVHYTDTHPTRNVVYPSGAWFENRPHLTPSIHRVWNPKHIIVQWVGIGTHTHITTKNIHVRFVCYLKTRDFYLWSNLKNKVYKTNPPPNN